MFAFNIEILKKSFPNDVQTKGSDRVAGIHRTPLTKGVGYNHAEIFWYWKGPSKDTCAYTMGRQESYPYS